MVAKSSQKKEKFKTYGNVFDAHAEKALFDLHASHLFDELNHALSVGKEANIFIASSKTGNIIVKIYRLQNSNFNKMYDYIKDDPRYVYLKGKRRQTIFAWTQREYRNILKAREAGARVPKPIAFKDNILLMELIGEGTEAAPELKDAFPEKPENFFKKIVENIKKMWDAGLVHGDLSAFNILNHKENPVFIDFSQSTITKNPRAQELLERDVKNVCIHFKKSGLKPNQKAILEYINSKTGEKAVFFE